jgi:GAF domain-containing protein
MPSPDSAKPPSAPPRDSDVNQRRVLQSIVEVARSFFGAAAVSVFLLEQETGDLVFEAVAGEGEETLVGTRLPAGTGLAGWVLATRQPIVVEDLDTDPRFARETAAETGFVPKGLMAVPLLDEERALGVLEVLDRPQRSRFSLAEMDLLGLFAAQAALALDLLQRARRVQALLAGSGDELAVFARLAERLEALDGDTRARRMRLLEALEEVLRA